MVPRQHKPRWVPWTLKIIGRGQVGQPMCLLLQRSGLDPGDIKITFQVYCTEINYKRVLGPMLKINFS